MEIQLQKEKDGSALLTYEFDFSVSEDRATYRWLQILDEAYGSDRGVMLFTLANKSEHIILSTIRARLKDLEPAMPENGSPPPLHLLDPEQVEIREQLIETIRMVLKLIDLTWKAGKGETRG